MAADGVLRDGGPWRRGPYSRREKSMTSLKSVSILVIVFVISVASGCASNSTKAPDVTASIRQALDQAGLKDVSVSQDRDKNLITLTGKVANDNDKLQAESIARSMARTQVVSNQISVRPPGEESIAKKVESDLDKGIEKNLDAVLVQHRLTKDVRYEVNNGVVTLKGSVRSQSQRATVEKLAAQVPNVKQVVNELEVKNQKATSSR
jgi:hyperosmotically inducible protein